MKNCSHDTKEDLEELVEMLEIALGVLWSLGGIDPNVWGIDEDDVQEFVDICEAWVDGEEGYEAWAKDKDVQCSMEVPKSMMYNIKEVNWKLDGLAYKHSRDIVRGGQEAFNKVVDLYEEELGVLGESNGLYESVEELITLQLLSHNPKILKD